VEYLGHMMAWGFTRPRSRSFHMFLSHWMLVWLHWQRLTKSEFGMNHENRPLKNWRFSSLLCPFCGNTFESDLSNCIWIGYKWYLTNLMMMVESLWWFMLVGPTTKQKQNIAHVWRWMFCHFGVFFFNVIFMVVYSHWL
jgi:hypothetical protein